MIYKQFRHLNYGNYADMCRCPNCDETGYTATLVPTGTENCPRCGEPLIWLKDDSEEYECKLDKFIDENIVVTVDEKPEVKDYKGNVVGTHRVEGISYLATDTVMLTFETERIEEEGTLVTYLVELWLDEGKWAYIGDYFDEEGEFQYGGATTAFTAEEKRKCREIILEYVGNTIR